MQCCERDRHRAGCQHIDNPLCLEHAHRRRLRARGAGRGRVTAIGKRRRDLRPDQYHHPAAKNPEQENRHARECAIDKVVSRHPHDVGHEQMLDHFKQQPRDEATDDGMAHRHIAARHYPIREHQRESGQCERHNIQQPVIEPRHDAIELSRQVHDVGCHRQASADQQRAEGQQRQICREPLPPRTPLPRAPDVVERAVDRKHQRNCRGQDDD